MLEPFQFTPSAGPSIEGPAFSRTFKAVTTVMVFGVGFWLALVWLGEKAKGGSNSLLAYFFAALVMLVFFWWWILRSRTRIDTAGLHQTWFADKHMAMGELAIVNVIRIRGLEWLVAPRVQARTLNGKYTVFQAADPALLDEFSRLSSELQAFRQR
ncbi:hypothetical protein [Ramlibacter sp. PS4R-6]|uniref:hypothetical protein n=1 Tax=Ramlibacter sp. PS4R-6 TaxID=3133438 RepID=UPI00309F3E96